MTTIFILTGEVEIYDEAKYLYPVVVNPEIGWIHSWYTMAKECPDPCLH
jgi:hypothetical protein